MLAVAAIARLLQCGEGLPYLHTWDEPYTASAALHMMQTGTLNPGFFRYGSVTIYLNLLVDVLHYFYLMGRPETAPAYLTSLDDIRTHFQTGWFWTISHPSFFLWNRWITAVLGTASVGIVYLLGRRVAGRWGGIAAAAFLAGNGFHVAHSALIATDVPSSFLVLAAAYLSVLFLERGRPAYFVSALAACGLAISTKYNAALSLSMPLLALLWTSWNRSDGYRWWLWIALPLVPALVFLAGTPYALLDLPRFLDDAAGELRHYKVLGHGDNTVTPGLPHLLLQLKTLTLNLGPAGAALSILGLLAVLSSRIGWMIMILPALHLLFMSGTRISFHRNFIVIYPFASVAFGAGSVLLWRLLRHGTKSRPRFRLAAPAGAAAVGILLLLGLGRAVAGAWTAGMTPETRSEAMRRAASLADFAGTAPARIGVAEELRVHEADLRRLGARYDLRPYLDLICNPAPYSLVVLPGRFAGLLARFRPAAEVMTAASSPRLSLKEEIGDDEPIYLDRFSVNPAVRILEVSREARTGSGSCVGLFAPADLLAGAACDVDEGGVLRMSARGSVSSPWVFTGKGRHAYVWKARGRWGAGEYPKLAVTALQHGEGEASATLEERIIELTSTADPYTLAFEIRDGALVALKLDFVNGSDPDGSRGNRQVFLEAVALLRLP